MKSEMRDGRFYYPELGWANYALDHASDVAADWALSLCEGTSAEQSEALRERWLACDDAFRALLVGEY